MANRTSAVTTKKALVEFLNFNLVTPLLLLLLLPIIFSFYYFPVSTSTTCWLLIACNHTAGKAIYGILNIALPIN